MSWRSVKARRSGDKVTLEFFEEGYYTRKRRLSQVTIREDRLLSELRRVGLLEPSPTLRDEIALYAALETIAAGPNTKLSEAGKKRRSILWNRITEKMGL